MLTKMALSSSTAVHEVSKEIGITRKFFGDLGMTLDTARLIRGTPLIDMIQNSENT